MKTKLVTLVCFLYCSGCVDQGNQDIAQLRKELPLIETPAEYNSDRMVKYKSVEIAGNKIIDKLKLHRPYFTLLGKLFETENQITVVGYIHDGIGTPILYTFDNAGGKIDSLVIFKTAIRGIGHYTSNVVKIFPDRRILFTDSAIVHQVKAPGTGDFPESDSVLVSHKTYRVTDTGVIETEN